jgi:hypothetical protein
VPLATKSFALRFWGWSLKKGLANGIEKVLKVGSFGQTEEMESRSGLW